MSSEHEAAIGEIRKCFQHLRALADALHGDLGINASMRAVLEFLTEHSAMTVPGIAREKTVSRQHIQTIVDQLLAARLVELRVNPAHRASPLIALTPRGARLFAEVRQRERAVIADLEARIPKSEARALNRALAHLRRELHDMLQFDHPQREEAKDV